MFEINNDDETQYNPCASASILGRSRNVVSDDYSCFMNTEGKGSKVETLPTSSIDLEIFEDLLYFTKKLATSLYVPASYLKLND
jgi:hypothetical protein